MISGKSSEPVSMPPPPARDYIGSVKMMKIIKTKENLGITQTNNEKAKKIMKKKQRRIK